MNRKWLSRLHIHLPDGFLSKCSNVIIVASLEAEWSHCVYLEPLLLNWHRSISTQGSTTCFPHKRLSVFYECYETSDRLVRTNTYFCYTGGQNIDQHDIGFEVFIAVLKKSCIFWNITWFSLLEVSWHFRETCHLHLQGWIVSQGRNQHTADSEQGSACCLLHACFFPGIFFNPEDGGNMLLWNVRWLSINYMVSYSRRQNCSQKMAEVYCWV
jgi:hypothetical protein